MGCASFPRVIVLEDPLTPREHLNLGVAYEKRGELDSAIKEYKLASEKIHVAYLYLGNAYFRKNELDKAEKYYKQAIKKDTDNADACNNLAWLYYTKGENLDEAEKLVLKAMKLNPSKNDIYRDTLEKIRKRKLIGGHIFILESGFLEFRLQALSCSAGVRNRPPLLRTLTLIGNTDKQVCPCHPISGFRSFQSFLGSYLSR